MEILASNSPKRGSISRQIAARLAVGAIMVTLLSLAVLGLLDYRDRVDAARKALGEIAQSSAPGIAGSLWGFDTAQLQIIVDGLTRIPSISHVLVLDEKGVEVAQPGHQIDDAERRLEKRVDLIYRDPAIEPRVGELRAVVDRWPLEVAAVERLLPHLIAVLLVVSALGAVFFRGVRALRRAQPDALFRTSGRPPYRHQHFRVLAQSDWQDDGYRRLAGGRYVPFR